MDESTQSSAEEVVVTPAEGNAPIEGVTEAQEAAPTEAPKEEVKPEAPVEDPRLAQKFAALSRKEKQIKERERQLTKQMQELEQRLQAAQEKEQMYSKFSPDRLKKEPANVLKEAGLTVEDLTQMLLNGGKPTEEMQRSELESKVMAEVRKLQEKLEAKEKAEQEAKINEQLNAFVSELNDFVNKNPDYDLIRANNATDVVYQVIEQHYLENREAIDSGEMEVLSNKDAADMVEQHLMEEAKKLLDREKVKKLYAQQTPTKPAEKGKPSPTLSNTQASRVPSGTQNMSKEESIAAAAQLIRWED